MSTVKVNFNQLKQAESGIRSTERSISRIKGTVRSILSSLDWDIKAQGGINSSANEINRKLDNYCRTLNKYDRFLDETIQKYRVLDDYGKNRKDPSKIHTTSGKSSNGNSSSKHKNPLDDLLHSPVVEMLVDKMRDFLRILKNGGLKGIIPIAIFGTGSFLSNLFSPLLTKEGREKAYKKIKDILNKVYQFGGVAKAGMAKSAMDYLEKLYNFVKSDKKTIAGPATLCQLTNSSVGLWNALSELLTGEKNHYIGAVGKGFKSTGTLLEAFQYNNKYSQATNAANYMDALASYTDIGVEIGKTKVGAFHSPLVIGGTLIKTGVGITSQTIRSVDKYYADGVWDFNDTVNTAFEVSATGVYNIFHNIIGEKFDAAVGSYSPQEFIDNLNKFATDTGTFIGNAIVDFKKLFKR